MRSPKTRSILRRLSNLPRLWNRNLSDLRPAKSVFLRVSCHLSALVSLIDEHYHSVLGREVNVLAVFEKDIANGVVLNSILSVRVATRGGMCSPRGLTRPALTFKFDEFDKTEYAKAICTCAPSNRFCMCRIKESQVRSVFSLIEQFHRDATFSIANCAHPSSFEWCGPRLKKP